MLGALVALSGCFKEEYGFCPDPYNVILHYRLPDGNGGCTFLSDISTVTTAVYDASGALVETVVTGAEDHDGFKGISLKLDPGTYRLAAWGNVDANTVFGDLTSCYTGGNPTVMYNSIVGGRVGDGDPVYYGPNTVRARSGNDAGEFVITVADDPYEGTLDFRHAHRRIEVFVKGFSAHGSTTPLLRLTGLPAGLTFLGMGQLAGEGLVNSEVQSQTVTVSEGGTNVAYALSPFHVFYLNTADYDIGIEVIDPSNGEVVYTTRLEDHIDTSSDDPDKIILRLVLEFKGTTVTVTVPGWNSDDVDYGIFD